MQEKRIIVSGIVIVGSIGVALSYFGIYVLVTSFAAGLVWYASLAILISGPVSGVGALIARREPRQRVAFAIGLLGLGLWIVLWILMFTVLGFKIG